MKCQHCGENEVVESGALWEDERTHEGELLDHGRTIEDVTRANGGRE